MEKYKELSDFYNQNVRQLLLPKFTYLKEQAAPPQSRPLPKNLTAVTRLKRFSRIE